MDAALLMEPVPFGGDESDEEPGQLASNAPSLSKGLLTLASELDELEAMLLQLQPSTADMDRPSMDPVGSETNETAPAWPEVPDKHLLGFGCASAGPPSTKALVEGVMVQRVSSGRWGCPAMLYAVSGGPVLAAEPTNPLPAPLYTCCAHAHAITSIVSNAQAFNTDIGHWNTASVPTKARSDAAGTEGPYASAIAASISTGSAGSESSTGNLTPVCAARHDLVWVSRACCCAVRRRRIVN